MERNPKFGHMVRGIPLALLLALAPDSAPAATQTMDGVWAEQLIGAPSARREYAAVYDVQRDRYLIFGGAGPGAPDPSSLNNEVWILALHPSPAWTMLTIPGDAPGERHSPQWGYDPANQRVLMFGGYGHHYPGGPNEYLNDVWELSLADEPAWRELFPTGTPPSGRLAGASVYDPLRQRFVGFGGTVGLPVDTWELDLSGDPHWSTVDTDSTSPAGGYGMSSIYDPRRDRMLIFGGSTSDAYFGVRNDVWELSLAGTPVWKQLQPGGPLPSPRRTLTSIYDPVRDRMVNFAGWDGGPGVEAFLGDAWALSLADPPQWIQLAPTGGSPVGRDAIAAAYDDKRDQLIVYGGWSGTRMLQDTWFLQWSDPGTPAAMVATSGASPGVATLQWNVANTTGRPAAVYRRTPGQLWSSVARLTSTPAGQVTFEDYDVVPGLTYGYQLVVPTERGSEFGGEVQVNVPESATGVPPGDVAFALEPVRPNPLAGRFLVWFTLPAAGDARIEVLDVAGRRVDGRDLSTLDAGRHLADLGDATAFGPGLYFVRLTQRGLTLTTRVVIAGR